MLESRIIYLFRPVNSIWTNLFVKREKIDVVNWILGLHSWVFERRAARSGCPAHLKSIGSKHLSLKQLVFLASADNRRLYRRSQSLIQFAFWYCLRWSPTWELAASLTSSWYCKRVSRRSTCFDCDSTKLKIIKKIIK